VRGEGAAETGEGGFAACYHSFVVGFQEDSHGVDDIGGAGEEGCVG